MVTLALASVFSGTHLLHDARPAPSRGNPAYECVQQKAEAWIAIVGDSNGRYLFEALVDFVFGFSGVRCTRLGTATSWASLRLNAPTCARSHPAHPWSDREVIGTYGDARGVRLSFRFVSGSDTKVGMVFKDIGHGYAHYRHNRTIEWDYADPIPTVERDGAAAARVRIAFLQAPRSTPAAEAEGPCRSNCAVFFPCPERKKIKPVLARAAVECSRQ